MLKYALVALIAALPGAGHSDSLDSPPEDGRWQVPFSIEEARQKACSHFEIGWSRTDIRSMEVVQYADAYARWTALGCDPAVPVLFDDCLRSFLGRIPVQIVKDVPDQKKAIRFCAEKAVIAARSVPEISRRQE